MRRGHLHTAIATALLALSLALPAGASAAIQITELLAQAETQTRNIVVLYEKAFYNSNRPNLTTAGAHPYLNLAIRFCNRDPDDYDVTICSTDQWNNPTRDLIFHLPPGLVGDPRAIPRCPEAAFAAQECPPETRVADIGVFVDKDAPEGATNLMGATGHIFNLETPPDQVARFGTITDADNIDPIFSTTDIEVRTSTDFGLDLVARDLPTTGVGSSGSITAKAAVVELSLYGTAGNPAVPFLTNPTSCQPSTIGVSANSWTDSTYVSASVPFQATGCDQLSFAPGMALRAGAPGQTKRGSAPPVTATSTETDGQARIKNATVTSAGSLLRPTVASLAANACSPESLADRSCTKRIGQATIVTPLLAQPLVGQVRVARIPNELAMTMRADFDGVLDFDIDGRVGFTGMNSTVTLSNLPDIPITSFSLSLDQGLMGAVADLCTNSGLGSATFASHAGGIASVAAPLQVDGCTPSASVKITSKVAIKKGKAQVTLACARTGVECRGTLTLKGNRKRVGGVPFQLASGETKTVVAKLSKAAKKLLAKRKKLKATATATLTKGDTSSQSVTLRVAR